MTRMTQDQWERLSPEQQEAVGALEAARIKRRQELLTQARNARRPLWAALLIVALGFVGLFLLAKPPQFGLVFFPFLFALIIIQFHVACINRRLDALLELLESELQATAHNDGATDKGPV